MSAIEWTDATWNPVRGCTRVSEGCRNCYAERQAARNLPSMRSPTTGEPFAVMAEHGPRWTGAVELIPEKLAEPLRWRKPRRIFVNSMSDLFHEALPFEDIAAVFGVMAACPQHTFQVLTKRPERAVDFFSWLQSFTSAPEGQPAAGGGWCRPLSVIVAALHRSPVDFPRSLSFRGDHPWPLPNLWLGTSVEDQATADARIPHLLRCPAAVRFVSYEPALGPVDFGPHLPCCADRACEVRAAGGFIDWIIVGGESGPGGRPFDVAWAREAIGQCRARGTAAFCKQLGTNVIDSTGLAGVECTGGWWPNGTKLHVGSRLDAPMRAQLANRKGGDMSEWPNDLRVREFPC